ncbi:MAG: hypothetical protein M3N47_04820 [Chloroflexota bacterium]|nr:hypothetical protein [Chloroflexota bacterium]
MTRQRWISIAATIAAAGGSAWLIKFPVVAATQQESTAASILYLVGVLCLFIGSTWLGTLAAADRSRLLLAALVILSPIAFWISYSILDGLALALVGDSAAAWLQDELGIAAAGALWLAASAYVLRPGSHRLAHSRSC